MALLYDVFLLCLFLGRSHVENLRHCSRLHIYIRWDMLASGWAPFASHDLFVDEHFEKAFSLSSHENWNLSLECWNRRDPGNELDLS